ncbi:unnamed protein product [Closterium sp. NIES-54]
MDIFALDYDAILTAMYALPLGTESACSLCVLPDPGIESAALGASESALPGNVPAEALHTFTLDSGASRCFFHDNTTLTPLSAPIPVRLADPSEGQVLARSSTVLPCPAATQRSSQGYTFGLGSGSVSWRATRSSSVLGSSCEAEIYAGAMAAQELRWLTYLLTDLGEPPRSPPVLYVDNKAMLALCREQRLEHRTKHIALRYFLARELQQRGQLRLAYVASEANTADVFTKALAPCDHQRCCTQLGARGGRGRGRGGHGGRRGGAANLKHGDNESESRDDRFPGQFFMQAPAGPEKDEGFEEPASVGKVTLHSLDYWVIDSGATYSMTPRADLLTELELSPVKHVTSALGQRAEVKGMGKAMFKGVDGKMVGLKNVLRVPNLAANLISVRRLQKAGMDTSSQGAKTYTARLGERILWELHKDRNVYNEMWQIPVVPMPNERQVAASISTKGEAVGSGDGANGRAKEIESKKCNLGGTSKLGEHEESGAAAQKQHKGEENPKAAAERACGALLRVRNSPIRLRLRGSFTRYPFSSLEATAKAPLDEVVMDVVGPLKLGAARAKYFLNIVDVYTRMTWPDAVRSACVAKNRALTHVGADKWVPYVEWIGRKPKVDMLRVFGCMCMALVPKHLRHNKLSAKAIWAVHLGMAQNSKGWLLWDPFTKKFLAPREWYLKLRGVLEEIGFTPSTADYSLFMLGEGEQRSFMVVYMDDILIFSPSSDLVKEVMLKLQDKFKCKALGDVNFYLGLHIERDVEKQCMRCVKGPEEESVGEEERRHFHSLVGSLMYAAVNTRPDVAFATGQLARVVQCPNEEQVAPGMRVGQVSWPNTDGWAAILGSGAKPIVTITAAAPAAAPAASPGALVATAALALPSAASASVPVKVLGVKESADLKEGFGFFLQHVLSGGVEKAHAEGKGREGAGEFGGMTAGKAEGKGRGGAGKSVGLMGQTTGQSGKMEQAMGVVMQMMQMGDFKGAEDWLQVMEEYGVELADVAHLGQMLGGDDGGGMRMALPFDLKGKEQQQQQQQH